jgi:hypothetical protein
VTPDPLLQRSYAVLQELDRLTTSALDEDCDLARLQTLVEQRQALLDSWPADWQMLSRRLPAAAAQELRSRAERLAQLDRRLVRQLVEAQGRLREALRRNTSGDGSGRAAVYSRRV